MGDVLNWDYGGGLVISRKMLRLRWDDWEDLNMRKLRSWEVGVLEDCLLDVKDFKIDN